MNAPSPSTQRLVVSPTGSAVHAPAVVLIAPDARAAANDDAVAASDHRTNPLWLNPLWAITAALAIFLGIAAVFVATY
jgi:hypothetical protein